jgi:hypothetical protein
MGVFPGSIALGLIVGGVSSVAFGVVLVLARRSG